MNDAEFFADIDLKEEDDAALSPEALEGLQILLRAMEITRSHTMGDLMAHCQEVGTTPAEIVSAAQ